MNSCRKSTESERDKVREIAKDVVEGRITALEGARALVPFAYSDAIAVADDRRLIVAVDSETDDLPIGEVRQHWATGALTAKDAEIVRCEALYRDQVLAVCRRLLG